MALTQVGRIDSGVHGGSILPYRKQYGTHLACAAGMTVPFGLVLSNRTVIFGVTSGTIHPIYGSFLITVWSFWAMLFEWRLGAGERGLAAAEESGSGMEA